MIFKASGIVFGIGLILMLTAIVYRMVFSKDIFVGLEEKKFSIYSTLFLLAAACILLGLLGMRFRL